MLGPFFFSFFLSSFFFYLHILSSASLSQQRAEFRATLSHHGCSAPRPAAMLMGFHLVCAYNGTSLRHVLTPVTPRSGQRVAPPLVAYTNNNDTRRRRKKYEEEAASPYLISVTRKLGLLLPSRFLQWRIRNASAPRARTRPQILILDRSSYRNHTHFDKILSFKLCTKSTPTNYVRLSTFSNLSSLNIWSWV